MYYLKRYVSGSAKKLLTDFSGKVHQKPRNERGTFYIGHPFIVTNVYRDKLWKWPKIGMKDHQGLRRFADFLTSVETAMQVIQKLPNCQNEQAITVDRTNRTQVLCALELLKTSKATGNDTIPAKVLKLAAKELSTPPTKLYNSCISSGKWSEWKRGEWIPVFKKDNHLDKENYRPVTVLSAVDKVFEQLISIQITSQFESRLSDCITAYCKSQSCETTLASLVEQWKLARDGHQCVAILSTDMSKAFDSLHPQFMLNKLRAYGFEENTINLLRSYLSNQQNRTRMGSQTSSWQVVNRGCPQGSATRICHKDLPLLWNIFQNDLAYEIKSNLSMHADDHQIYEAGKDLANTRMLKKLPNGLKTTCLKVTVVNTKPWQCRTKET